MPGLYKVGAINKVPGLCGSREDSGSPGGSAEAALGTLSVSGRDSKRQACQINAERQYKRRLAMRGRRSMRAANRKVDLNEGG